MTFWSHVRKVSKMALQSWFLNSDVFWGVFVRRSVWPHWKSYMFEWMKRVFGPQAASSVTTELIKVCVPQPFPRTRQQQMCSTTSCLERKYLSARVQGWYGGSLDRKDPRIDWSLSRILQDLVSRSCLVWY